MFINPYENNNIDGGQWLKANFHTHAGTGENTCGHYEIEEVIAAYKGARYDVLTISNHDLFSDVQKYQEKYEMVIINGFEFSTDPHMLCIGNTGVIKGNHQDVINECRKQRGLVILCHPNWQRMQYWPWKDMADLKGYTGMEIFNSVIYRLNGKGLAADAWDFLLSQGKLVWGFGNDDFHRWHDIARSWNMIYAKRDKDSVMNSLSSGNFYVSTGMILKEFSFNDGTIRASAVSYNGFVTENKYIFIGKGGEILKEQTGEYGEYKMDGSELYVRVQVVSEHGAMLWTQPIYDEERFKKQEDLWKV
ncbi:MAG TPA: hypothetical protein GXX14_01255 [Clostridiaceae bacterium]|nr:hypothetical protein [Clostridiaceae bacterium]